jgi:hypothetical protein
METVFICLTIVKNEKGLKKVGKIRMRISVFIYLKISFYESKLMENSYE